MLGRVVVPWIFMQFYVFANVIKVMRCERRSISLVAGSSNSEVTFQAARQQ